MVRATVVDLIGESPEAHGVFEQRAEISRTVFAEIRSVTGSEFYRAKGAGIEPTLVFRLTDYSDYQGEKIVVYEGKRYRVIRSYVAGQSIELTVEVATNDR